MTKHGSQPLFRDRVVQELESLQDSICKGLETLDGRARFREDAWTREEGGGGRSRVLTDGDLIEKGGVNFSHVFGPLPEALKSPKRNASEFHATGVSIVLHPRNPYVPITHMNVRYFEMNNGEFWFGGGIDLTPVYPYEEDARFFHQSLKTVCDSIDPALYPAHKQWCDEYFTIKHRGEMRGIGGIFFDDLKPGEGVAAKLDAEQLLKYILKVGQAFVPAYAEIANKHRRQIYGERERKWQNLRRGRYVEFNLVYDRGTQFGLQTRGRTESILMSMPPQAEWIYDHSPEKNSIEYKALSFYQPRSWV